jgi:hypothetical protein
MFEIWVKTEDDVYRVKDCDDWSELDLLLFYDEVKLGGDADFDVHALMPRLELAGSRLTARERRALEHGTLVVHRW